MELDWVPLTVTDSTRDVGSHCGLCLTYMRNKLLLVNSATWFVHMTTQACYFSICTQGLKIIKSNCQSVSNCLLKFAKRSCLQTLAEKEEGNPPEDLLFILRLYSLSLKVLPRCNTIHGSLQFLKHKPLAIDKLLININCVLSWHARTPHRS